MNSVRDEEWQITSSDSTIVPGKDWMWISFYPCATFFLVLQFNTSINEWINELHFFWISFFRYNYLFILLSIQIKLLQDGAVCLTVWERRSTDVHDDSYSWFNTKSFCHFWFNRRSGSGRESVLILIPYIKLFVRRITPLWQLIFSQSEQ